MGIFAATIGLSAFLLFLVQPIIAKQILPWFGGSAAVWATCMVFFQLVLLAGYAYSDLMIRRITPRRQALVHGVLVLASLAMLPIVPSEAFKPEDADNPIGRILLLLAATIGLPYFMLSTTGPLVQAWFARHYAHTPWLASVWRLYALSNVASLAALIGYPPLIEPASSSRQQSLGWSIGYGGFVLLALASAWLATRAHVRDPVAVPVTDPGTGSTAAAADTQLATLSPPSATQQGGWLLLAALGSVFLLSITTHITQNVASVPFLWVMPLAIYLVSFILTFDGRGWYWPVFYRWLAALAAVLMMGGLVYRPQPDWKPADGLGQLLTEGLLPLDWALPLYGWGLFVMCMYFHGELVARKPAPAHLTRFYLMVSLGGAVGGTLVGVLAPLAFNWYWELPVALLAAAGVVAWHVRPRASLATVAALASVVACGALGWRHVVAVHDQTIEMSRNFYGTLRVRATAGDEDENARWRLLHGVIMHGEQYRAPQHRHHATSYYGESSGVAVALRALRAQRPGQPQSVGLIGLGVGTLASYGREGDSYQFYELNPTVLEIADRRFTYLDDSKARVETFLGDARLVLERQAPQGFDLLAVDAFSSDSIPVHLITREALAVYRRHLREGGTLAFHISNRYLDLQPVLHQLAEEAGLQAWIVVDDPPDDSPLSRSDWVLLTRNAPLLESLAAQGKGEVLPSGKRIRPWTDDHNNLFDVLR